MQIWYQDIFCAIVFIFSSKVILSIYLSIIIKAMNNIKSAPLQHSIQSMYIATMPHTYKYKPKEKTSLVHIKNNLQIGRKIHTARPSERNSQQNIKLYMEHNLVKGRWITKMTVLAWRWKCRNSMKRESLPRKTWLNSSGISFPFHLFLLFFFSSLCEAFFFLSFFLFSVKNRLRNQAE